MSECFIHNNANNAVIFEKNAQILLTDTGKEDKITEYIVKIGRIIGGRRTEGESDEARRTSRKEF